MTARCASWGANQGRQVATRTRDSQQADRGLFKKAWARLAEMF